MLRLWVCLRLPLTLALALPLAGALGDLAAGLLIRSGYPHGLAKLLVESWQILLFRQDELPRVAAACAALAALGSALGGRAWLGWAAGVVGLALALAPWHHLPALGVALALLLGAGAPRASGPRLPRAARAWAWLPGTELLTPSVVAAVIGVGPRGHALVVALGGLALGGLWGLADSALSYEHFKRAMAAWPAELTDPRVSVMDRMPPWARADFHGVDIVGDHALVVAEDRTLLRAYPLDGPMPVPEAAVRSVKLADRWDGIIRAATLDSETDPATGLTWALDGPSQLVELRWTGQGFEELRRRRFPFHLGYAYTRWDPQGRRLLLAGVQVQADSPRVVASVGVPGLTFGRAVEVRADEGPMPVPREIEWIPPTRELILAPDFGHQLYRVDPDSGRATPWLEVPTLDGKMRWVPELERLFLAIPNRPELWVIDPVAGVVERRIPTQPGVRAVAVDPERRLLLTASVLTGVVLVQDLDTGAVVDHFGTVMPMVRELKLHVGRGEAVLSTWTVLYKIPYAPPQEPP